MFVRFACLCLIASSSAISCGEETETTPEPTPIDVLDPEGTHYGDDYAGWAARWIKWYFESSYPSCAEFPALDPSGVHCGLNQPEEEVFFLAGNTGGATVRDACVVPAGKALVFPLIVTFADNGGLPVDAQRTDEQWKIVAEEEYFEMIPTSELVLEVDGQPVPDLERLAVVAVPYSYTVPAEPNIFSCAGSPNATGTYPGYSTGYFALLPPLEPGTHSIRLGGSLGTGADAFVIDVTFDPLTVE